ncbi:class I SAM-dependent methyltransferase [Anabaena azotica]|uniref:Class I SAM-dependent methyltransferase n=1 Tax=Anabaena azotica FACHB-119 TaxID=947527 RepID=A0ABR8D777_9NOST|nr:class I SAM-dependent methyltransferase [Anabaena azotica]MBD2502391.1 class I SAM-dependent methyltransferase [Anabaena azotica FACHB-119]
MPAGKKTIWDTFLSPIFRFLIDEDKLRRYAQSINWEKECDRLRRHDVIIPSYYSSQNFHGIEGGYLNCIAAISYDSITEYVTPPNETWVRQTLINAVKVQPRRILDLGCGTGSTTIMLKQAFPQADVIGLDLSPYMLVRAEDKAKTAGLDITWRQGNAEKTSFPDASFDLITAALLFHETPVAVSQAILQECSRLLVTGGQVLILDGSQKSLRQLEWLNKIFEEPYIHEYAADSVDAWMGAAGFDRVSTEDVWWIHQLTSGVKPISATDRTVNVKDRQYLPAIDNNNLEGLESPVLA